MHIITTHTNTDFDGLASVIAGTLLFPGSIGVIPTSVNANVAKFLSTHKTAFNIVLPREIDLDGIETLTVVDTDHWRRIDRLSSLKDRPGLKINIWDHHQNGGDIEADFICQEPVGATVTLLIRELKKKDMELNPLFSTILLIGLYEDTGHLSFPATKPEDAMAAAFLLERGADLNVAATFLNPSYEETQKDVLFTMIQNTEKIQHNSCTVGINILRLKKKVPMLAAVVSMYRKIINADAVFVILINDQSSSTVIARSGVDRIDVAALLRKFGGGGHPAAASVTIKSKDFGPAEIKDKIIALVKKTRGSGVVVADLMSFPVTFVTAERNMNEVRQIMQDKNIRGVLVGSETDLQGIIVIWDFKKLKLDRQWKQPVKTFMVRDVTTTKPDMLAAEAAQFMVQQNIGHLPVCHGGKIIGIVTRTDILNYFYNLLPE